jgi:hypothetical protein
MAEMNVPDVSISFRLIEERWSWRAGRRAETGAASGLDVRRGRQELLLELETVGGRGETADYEYALVVPGAVEVPEQALA